MGSKKQTADDIRQNLAEQLDWQFAERNVWPSPRHCNAANRWTQSVLWTK
jgi:hypothetical protein